MDYNLRVYKVGNRVVDGKKQVYNLLLVSEEALINESFKIQEPLDENPESIIIKLLREKLLTNKEIYSEPSKFKIRMIPGNLRVFDIIAKLIKKSVSAKASYSTENSSTDIRDGDASGDNEFGAVDEISTNSARLEIVPDFLLLELELQITQLD